MVKLFPTISSSNSMKCYFAAINIVNATRTGNGSSPGKVLFSNQEKARLMCGEKWLTLSNLLFIQGH